MLNLTDEQLDEMLAGGAQWALRLGYGNAADLERTEEWGTMAGAQLNAVSDFAKNRQRREMLCGLRRALRRLRVLAHGDLLVRLAVEIPANPTSDELKLWRQLQDLQARPSGAQPAAS